MHSMNLNSASLVEQRPALQIVERAVDELRPYKRNARTHSKKQIAQIAASIRQFGFTNPVLIDGQSRILAGHGRVEAAISLEMTMVPTIQLDHLSDEERRAYILADNKIAQQAGWDPELLSLELKELAAIELDFELEVTGFETVELDFHIFGEEGEQEAGAPLPALSPDLPVTRAGDVWHLGEHRLICGDGREPAVYDVLMGEDKATMVFTDPPYNVKVDGHVCGSGAIKHREFAMASGEMSEEEFTEFLSDALYQMACVSTEGSIHYVCMDWRHMDELLHAGRQAYDELKNLIVWRKTNAGMGSFYRSQHELIFVWKRGSAPHRNNFGLGEMGRYRTNVWDYPGVNGFGKNKQDLKLHPTVKPVQMVVDAIKDVTKRGDIVLDGFGGSGSTLIAAERTNRRARLVELDPVYCDLICRRFEQETGLQPVLAGDNATFEDVLSSRGSTRPETADTGKAPFEGEV